MIIMEVRELMKNLSPLESSSVERWLQTLGIYVEDYQVSTLLESCDGVYMVVFNIQLENYTYCDINM